MRYFSKLKGDGLPANLYRFNIIDEDRWYADKGWVPTKNISAYLAIGEGDYDEITESLAREYFPDAFNELAKSIGSYELTKAEGEKQFTLGAMYIPDRIDAHGEWTDAEELQRAVWDYVRSGDRRIRLQHNRDVVAGEWVEVMAFPYPLTVPIENANGLQTTHTYPANTVFLGVIWEDWAWEKIKKGEILGYSIGGKAERLYVDMEKADGPTVSDVHVDTIMNPKKKKKLPKELADNPLPVKRPADNQTGFGS
jgi:hypothetical protein